MEEEEVLTLIQHKEYKMFVTLMAYEFDQQDDEEAVTKRVYVNPMSVATFGPYTVDRLDVTVISFTASDDIMFVAGTPEEVNQLLTNTARHN